MNCYCGSNKPLENCCYPIIKGITPAKTAEELMRSRYSAFVIADVDYLMKSHHIKTRPLKEKKNILAWTKSVSWVGLSIASTVKGKSVDTEGFVRFKATYVENGIIQCIHENSSFKKEKDEWFYVDGMHR